jgi:hypothetical protein
VLEDHDVHASNEQVQKDSVLEKFKGVNLLHSVFNPLPLSRFGKPCFLAKPVTNRWL